MYRYGDGSEFPLEENFIDTLTAAVEACAGAYTPIADLDDRKERAREGKRQADKELARLAELSETMEAAGDRFGPSTGRTATPVQQVAAKAIAAVKQAVDTAKSQIQTRVVELEADAKGAGLGQQVRTHLAPFFNKHVLPSATWAAAWDARGHTATGTAVATSGKIAATFDLQLGGTWSQGVRIDVLVPGLSLLLPKRKASKPQVVHLDKSALVAFERGGGHTTLIIRDKATGPSPGYRFTEENGTWIAVAIDHNNDVQGQEVAQTPEDAAGLVQLANVAAKAVEAYKGHRTLRDLRLANQSLDAHPQPRAIVDAVLAALTPLARSLKDKSRVQGELVLKRDLGGGKREEIFVPRAQLAAMFSPLPPEYRRPFEEMGLARESTQPGAGPSDRMVTMSEEPTMVTHPPIPAPTAPSTAASAGSAAAPPHAADVPRSASHGTSPPMGAAPRPPGATAPRPGSGTLPPPPPGGKTVTGGS